MPGVVWLNYLLNCFCLLECALFGCLIALWCIVLRVSFVLVAFRMVDVGCVVRGFGCFIDVFAFVLYYGVFAFIGGVLQVWWVVWLWWVICVLFWCLYRLKVCVCVECAGCRDTFRVCVWLCLWYCS